MQVPPTDDALAAAEPSVVARHLDPGVVDADFAAADLHGDLGADKRSSVPLRRSGCGGDRRGNHTTGEAPIVRFEREERQALRPLNGRPPFRQLRELTRRVQNDACVDVDTNHYSVPWKHTAAHTRAA